MKKVQVPPSVTYKLLHPRNVVLVSCVNETNGGNVITIAWSLPLSKDPPMLALSMAPERYSHALILKTGEFVVNIPTMEIVRNSLICGRISGKNCNKFLEASLTPLPSKKVKAPIIKECVAHVECKLKDSLVTGDHTLFVANVVEAYADPFFFSTNGFDATKFRPIFHIGGDDFITLFPEIIKPKI